MYEHLDAPLLLDEAVFVARLDARSNASGEWRYAWTEQAHNGLTGEYSDARPPRMGTVSINYATELNGMMLPVGDDSPLVWIRLKGSVAQMHVYEVVSQCCDSLTITATAGGTTTLTSGSTPQQHFTGTSNQTVQLPAVSTLALGTPFVITNGSSGLLTITSSGSNTIATVAPGAQATVMSIAASGTDASVWSVFTTQPLNPGVTSTATAGGTTTLTNTSLHTQTFTGTSNQTVQMPAVSTLPLGTTFGIFNQSSGLLTITSSGSNTIATVAPGAQVTLTSTAVTGTDASVWSALTTASTNPGVTTTATAGGTTTLTSTSLTTQVLTGTTTQTVQLPAVSTLPLGSSFLVVNQSTGNLTITSSGSNTIATVAPGAMVLLTSLAVTGTDATVWSALTTFSTNPGVTTTTTAGGTTTLTALDLHTQRFTGSTTQTVQMPAVSTLPLGATFAILNESTGALTMTSSGGNTIGVVPAGVSAIMTSVATSGTSASAWNMQTTNPSSTSGAVVSLAWRLVATVDHDDLTDADTSQDITVYTQSQSESVLAAACITQTAGGGGGVASLSTELIRESVVASGTPGNGLSTTGDRATWVATAEHLFPVAVEGGDAVWEIRFTADVNVADLSAGRWDFWILSATVP